MVTNEEKMLILLKWGEYITNYDLDEYYEEYNELSKNESFTEYIDWIMSDEYQELQLKEEIEFWQFIDMTGK